MRNLPNVLSTSRLIATVFIFVLVLVNQSWAFLVATIIFVLASATDYIDGYLARKLNAVSKLGVFLDLTSDKILVAVVLIALVQIGVIPAWIPCIVVTREFLVSGLRSLAATKGHAIPAGKWGKQKTSITLVAMAGLLFAKGLGAHLLSLFPPMLNFNSQTLNVGELLLLVSDCLMILAVIWTIFSGIEYMLGAMPIFRQGQSKP